jgi:oxalate decarboxylase/phosphoglucose isomerase-like protein (cupin superfamily)
MKPYAERTHEKMKDVLMSPNSPGPEVHYYMIRGGSDKSNITVWESGTVGGEYIKAYGHYHVGDLEEVYHILQGEGIIILQERDGADDEIKSFKAIRVKAGDKVHIPRNTGHLAVNIGKTWLVTSDDSPVNFSDADPVSMPGHADYEPFRKLHGAGYYVVEKDGEPTLVKNTNYKRVPEARIQKKSFF